jgi:hypothetical protein
MSRTIACEHCQRVLRLDPENLGKAVQCPACGRVQVAGEESSATLDQFSALPLASVAAWSTEDGIAVSLPSSAAEPAPLDVARPINCPYCQDPMPLSASQCPACQRAVDDTSLQDEIRRLDERRRKLNILSFVYGLPGIYLLFIAEVHLGSFIGDPAFGKAGYFQTAFSRLMSTSHPAWLAWPAYLFGPGMGMTLTLLFGLLLTGVGVGLAAKYKGQSGSYGLVVLLCFLGFFILPFLIRDKTGGLLERLRGTLLRRAGIDRVWNFQRDSSVADDDEP